MTGVNARVSRFNVGRNIWQDPNPVPKIRAIRSVVHEDYSPEEAKQLYEKLVEKEGLDD